MKKLLLFVYFSLLITAIASPLEEAKRFKAKHLYQPAIDVLEKALRQQPDDPALIMEYADTLFFTKQWEKSIPILERTIVANPQWTNVYTLFKAKSLSYLGRYRESAASYVDIEKTVTPSNKVLWEHLLVVIANGDTAARYVILGKLASRVSDPAEDKDEKEEAKSMIEIYEKWTEKGRDGIENAAKEVIESWAKH